MKIGLPFFFIILLLPQLSEGGTFSVTDSVIGQVRSDQNEQTEIPLNNYAGFSFTPAGKISADANMRFFYEPEQKIKDFDLYQTVLHYRASDLFKIDAGRQFVNQGFSVETLDGLQMTILPKGHIGFTVYAGVPRSVEIGDFNKDDGLDAGLSIALKNIPHLQARLQGSLRRAAMTNFDLRQNDQLLIGADLSYQLPGKSSPFLYTLGEYDATGNLFDTITAGLDFYPSKRISFNLEFDRFDIDRNNGHPSILSLFTSGPTLSGRLGSTWTLIPGRLRFMESYAYQSLEVGGAKEAGHLLDTALALSFENIGLNVEPGYYFSSSFGGHLHGVRLGLHEQFTDKLYTEAGVDYTTYVKITGNDDNAFASYLWSGYEVLKGFIVSGGMEYNQNNLFNKDVRGSFKLDYKYAH